MVMVPAARVLDSAPFMPDHDESGIASFVGAALVSSIKYGFALVAIWIALRVIGAVLSWAFWL